MLVLVGGGLLVLIAPGVGFVAYSAYRAQAHVDRAKDELAERKEALAAYVRQVVEDAELRERATAVRERAKATTRTATQKADVAIDRGRAWLAEEREKARDMTERVRESLPQRLRAAATTSATTTAPVADEF